MKERSLDLIFYQGHLDYLVFWWGWAVFVQEMKLDFLRQSEIQAFIFVTIESVFTIAIRLYT